MVIKTNRIQVLDCTLRDGGYCNQWTFGFENIKKIINGLVESEIDVIECGFLTQETTYNTDITKFTTVEEVAGYIPNERAGKLFVCMVNYGEYNLKDLPPYDGTSVDGIRVAFHKKDLEGALELCAGIGAKGYKVFVQAMVSLNYSDEEFLDLICRCNHFKPYAFYIVDSFGVMKRKDLTRLFYMVEHNLKEDILIGYHSHNNMQLAYSNAQALVDLQTKRYLIIDSSIFGMGRGAGNLNTELFVGFLNDNLGTDYKLKPLLRVIDEVLNNFYLKHYWGYSLPNYLSAVHNLHPDYAFYLDDKKTLAVENMDEIFSMMPVDKKNSFDRKYIEELYIRYMTAGKTYEEHLLEFKNKLIGKTILIIAPGRSVKVEKEKVIACAKREDIISIGINFNYPYYDTDYIFLSNLRRYKELDIEKRSKTIVTSNIPSDGVYIQVKYSDLLNNIDSIKDNAGMMVIQLLINLGVKEIMIAGIDGYSHDTENNYAEHQMMNPTRNAILDEMNAGMSKMLRKYSKEIKVFYLTKSKFI